MSDPIHAALLAGFGITQEEFDALPAERQAEMRREVKRATYARRYGRVVTGRMTGSEPRPHNIPMPGTEEGRRIRDSVTGRMQSAEPNQANSPKAVVDGQVVGRVTSFEPNFDEIARVSPLHFAESFFTPGKSTGKIGITNIKCDYEGIERRIMGEAWWMIWRGRNPHPAFLRQWCKAILGWNSRKFRQAGLREAKRRYRERVLRYHYGSFHTFASAERYQHHVDKAPEPWTMEKLVDWLADTRGKRSFLQEYLGTPFIPKPEPVPPEPHSYVVGIDHGLESRSSLVLMSVRQSREKAPVLYIHDELQVDMQQDDAGEPLVAKMMREKLRDFPPMSFTAEITDPGDWVDEVSDQLGEREPRTTTNMPIQAAASQAVLDAALEE